MPYDFIVWGCEVRRYPNHYRIVNIITIVTACGCWRLLFFPMLLTTNLTFLILLKIMHARRWPSVCYRNGFFLVLFCFFSESGFILIICTVCFRGKTTLSKRKYHRNLVWQMCTVLSSCCIPLVHFIRQYLLHLRALQCPSKFD